MVKGHTHAVQKSSGFWFGNINRRLVELRQQVFAIASTTDPDVHQRIEMESPGAARA
jgi:hypothetical protein